MGFRFRKSIKIGAARINISKTGIGCSLGIPGFRITKLANGRTRTTASIPGTGISYVKETSGKKRKKHTNPQLLAAETEFFEKNKPQESGLSVLNKKEKQIKAKTNKAANNIITKDKLLAFTKNMCKTIIVLFMWFFGLVMILGCVLSINLFGVLFGLLVIPAPYKFISKKWRIMLGVITFFGFVLTSESVEPVSIQNNTAMETNVRSISN